MKRILTSSILLLAFLATAPAQPLKQSEITTHSVQSAILGEEVAYNIYLPKGYDATTPERYPVIYLLHDVLFLMQRTALWGGFCLQIIANVVRSLNCRPGPRHTNWDATFTSEPNVNGKQLLRAASKTIQTQE